MVARLLTLPTLTAAGLGRFRVYVGLALLWLLARETPSAFPREFHRNYSPLADFELVHWLAATPLAWRGVQVIGVVAAACFVVGWWTRTAYAVMVAVLLLTRLSMLQSSGAHDWVCPMAILLALLVVPWGDGWSLDQRRAPSVDPNDRDPRYGFALFVPVFVMGLAFAAAAYAKLTVSGLAWVTTGAVRYHFVEDAENAATTWGLWVAAHPTVAIVFSAAAVSLEAAWFASLWLRRPAPRLVAAGAALSLFGGFYAFQGALWLPWWMWLGALLPWDGWRPLPSAPLRGSPAGMAAAALAVQVIASVGPVEVEPLMSPYQMYSGTYASPAAFEAARRRHFQRVRLTWDSQSIDVGGEAADSLAASIETGGIDEEGKEALRAACTRGARPAIDLEVSRAHIDWTAPRVKQTWVTVKRSLSC